MRRVTIKHISLISIAKTIAPIIVILLLIIIALAIVTGALQMHGISTIVTFTLFMALKFLMLPMALMFLLVAVYNLACSKLNVGIELKIEE